MAKKDKETPKLDTVEPEIVETAVETPPVVEPQAEAPVLVPRQLISFNAWFAGTGRRPRHKAGMAVFTNTNIRRTKDEWDAIYSKY